MCVLSARKSPFFLYKMVLTDRDRGCSSVIKEPERLFQMAEGQNYQEVYHHSLTLIELTTELLCV